jgi:hypothetical protein
MMVYQETFGQRNQHWIYVREHPGEEPAIILMYGFPDNVHLYDRLFPTGRILLLFGPVGLTASPSIGGASTTTAGASIGAGAMPRGVASMRASGARSALARSLLTASDAQRPYRASSPTGSGSRGSAPLAG